MFAKFFCVHLMFYQCFISISFRLGAESLGTSAILDWDIIRLTIRDTCKWMWICFKYKIHCALKLVGVMYIWNCLLLSTTLCSFPLYCQACVGNSTCLHSSFVPVYVRNQLQCSNAGKKTMSVFLYLFLIHGYHVCFQMGQRGESPAFQHVTWRTSRL